MDYVDTSLGASTSTHILRLDNHKELCTVYDIFLSHSGAQKGFAKDLYKVLSPHYNIFFDIEPYSLPPADPFPTRIFDAARQCRLAVVVLSKEFVRSKWPMLELCTFVDAIPSIKILPLFYLLSPSDLKDAENLKQLHTLWNSKQDDKHRLDVSKLAHALTVLRSLNGLVFDPSEGLLTYLDQITSSIFNILSPAIKCDDHLINGKDRLCKVILQKFQDMELREKPPRVSKAFVLGLYGPPGSGKSKMTLFLRDYLFSHYRSKVLYITLPAEYRSCDQKVVVEALKKLLGLTDFRNRINLENVSDVSEVIGLLRAHKLPSLRIFLVIDNVSDESVKAVRRVLELGVGPGSKVMLVARSLDVLLPALRMQGHRYICDSISMPNLLETEGADLLLQTVGAGLGLDAETIGKYLTPRQWETVLAIVRKCGFGSGNDIMYLPSVIEKVAEWLLRHNSGNQLGRLLECQGMSRVENYRSEAVRELLWESFRSLANQKLQLLFLDIALFILPAKIWAASEALKVLSSMHACSQETMEAMIEELRRSDFLRCSNFEFSVQDVHAEFAQSINEDCDMQFMGSLRRWMTYKCADPNEVGRDLLLRQDERNNYCQVRTMILEVGEGCRRITLHGFSTLKALVVRNSKSLAVLELVGLTSLVSLDIQACPNLKEVLQEDETHGSQTLKIRDADGYTTQATTNMRLLAQQQTKEPHCMGIRGHNLRWELQ